MELENTSRSNGVLLRMAWLTSVTRFRHLEGGGDELRDELLVQRRLRSYQGRND